MIMTEHLSQADLQHFQASAPQIADLLVRMASPMAPLLSQLQHMIQLYVPLTQPNTCKPLQDASS